jgi:hypothetical protein
MSYSCNSFNFIGAAGREKLLAAQAAQRQASGRVVAIELTGNDPVAAFLQAKTERDSLRESIMNSVSSSSSSNASVAGHPLGTTSNGSATSSSSSNGSNHNIGTVTTLIPTGTPPNGKSIALPSVPSLSINSNSSNTNSNKSGSPVTSTIVSSTTAPLSPIIAPIKRQDPPAALRGGLLGGTLGPFGALRAHRTPLSRHVSNASFGGTSSITTNTTNGGNGSPVLIPRSSPQPIPSSSSTSGMASPSPSPSTSTVTTLTRSSRDL